MTNKFIEKNCQDGRRLSWRSMELLESKKLGFEAFWKLEKKIRKERRKIGVIGEKRRIRMFGYM